MFDGDNEKIIWPTLYVTNHFQQSKACGRALLSRVMATIWRAVLEQNHELQKKKLLGYKIKQLEE